MLMVQLPTSGSTPSHPGACSYNQLLTNRKYGVDRGHAGCPDFCRKRCANVDSLDVHGPDPDLVSTYSRTIPRPSGLLIYPYAFPWSVQLLTISPVLRSTGIPSTYVLP